MRACFLGQNIYELGNGVAVLTSGWRELEPPKSAELKSPEKGKPKKNRGGSMKLDQNPQNNVC
jgi:hypothetical protein